MAEEEKKDAKAEGRTAEGSAEGAPAEGDVAAADAAKAKKKKMMLIASAAVAVIGIAVAVGVVFFIGGGEKKNVEAAAEGEAHIAVVDIPEFTVNLLSEDDSAQHFLKIRMGIEIGRKEDEATVTQLLPRLQDDWVGFMRQLRPADMQGSASLQRLKEGLLRRANQSLSPVTVKAVYIRELLVQ